MNIVIFGATGLTGRALVSQAITAKHQVTVFARSASEIELTAENLRVIEGDLLDGAAVGAALEGQAAVLCALDATTFQESPTLISEGTRNILKGMPQHGIKRIVCLLSGWLYLDEYPPKFKEITGEHARQLALLEASDRDWVGVCPPNITTDPGISQFRMTMGIVPLGGTNISCEDVARFMLAHLRNDLYVGETVGISY